MRLEERVEDNDTCRFGSAKMSWGKKHSPQVQIASEARQEGRGEQCLDNGDNLQRKERGRADQMVCSFTDGHLFSWAWAHEWPSTLYLNIDLRSEVQRPRTKDTSPEVFFRPRLQVGKQAWRFLTGGPRSRLSCHTLSKRSRLSSMTQMEEAGYRARVLQWQMISGFWETAFHLLEPSKSHVMLCRSSKSRQIPGIHSGTRGFMYSQPKVVSSNELKKSYG